MIILSGITPDGQITLPRSIMKSLGIGGGNDILIEVENGRLILKKVEKIDEKNEDGIVCKAG